METYNFSIARFTPDSIRDEPINIGAVINDNNLNTSFGKFVNIQTIKNKTGVPFNTNMLEHILQKLEGKQEPLKDVESLASEFSGRLSFTSPRAIKNENISSAMDSIFARYVSIIKPKQTRRDKQSILRKSIKTRLYRSIKSEFITPNHKIGVDPYISTVDFRILSNSCKSLVHVLHHLNVEKLLQDCLFKARCLKKLDILNNDWRAEIITDIPDNANEKTLRAWGEGTEILEDAGCNVSNESRSPEQIDKIVSLHISQT